MNTLRRRILSIFAAFAIVLAGGFLAPPAASADTEDPPTFSDEDTVSAEALPAPQVNGVVWKQAVAGSTVYAVGNFSSARPAGSPAGQNEVTRNNILAYDLNTGELLPFAPSLNNQAVDAAVSPDGGTVYIAGNFTSIDGQSRFRAAAFDTATGNLKSWRPVLNFRSTSITATDSTVYIGGAFSTVNNQTRTRLVGVDTNTGTTNTALNANIPDGDVRGVQVSPDGSEVAIAGSFTSVNGSDRPGFGLARIDVETSESLSFPVNNVIRNATVNAAIYSLDSDDAGIYGVGYDFYGPSTFEGGFQADWEGNLIWLDGCMGDSYDIWPDGDVVYQASHKHVCSQVGNFPQEQPWTFQHASANTNFATGVNLHGDFAGHPAPTMYAFRPEFQTGTFTGSNQAVWGVTGTDDYVLYAGEFPRVNNVAQQGIVRFARRDVSPDTEGPRIGGSAGTPSATAVPHTGLRVSVPGNYDRDDYELQYTVYRNNNSTVIYDGVRDSRWYDLSGFSIIDTGATPGDPVQYRVRVTDPAGNAAHSDWSDPVTAPETAQMGPLASRVLEDEPVHYWRMGEPSGSVAYNWAGGADLNLRMATRGVAGLNEDSLATRFSGSSVLLSYGSTSTREAGRNVFSIEAWFQTDQSGGGKILGFGSSSTGNSSSYDRHLYLDNQNRLTFGVYPGETRTVQTDGSVADGQWHHAVGTLDETGMRLYLDGQLIDERTDTTSAQSYSGFWRVAGDNTWSGNRYFNGSISDVAVYGKALTAEQVARHYNAGNPQPPVADFEVSTNGLEAEFDASTSSAIDGEIVEYEWEFGDGSSDSGVEVSHEYEAPGTYDVSLTVTDDRGADATVSKSVEVEELPNEAPVAQFEMDAVGLEVSFDATDSYDEDGEIVSYEWDFGDGSTSTGETTSHEYAEADTYEVTLTVTDDEDATGSLTRTIEVEAIPNIAPVAEFGFSVDELAVEFDASESSDEDGEIVSYEWDFGDGSTSTGETTSHEYAETGTYEVTLVVTDDDGATDSVVKTVEVAEAPNAAPVAEFNVEASGLEVSFDASESSDEDGEIVSYEWDFGDGSTSTGVTVWHEYAEADTYEVTLTVTDDDGDTGSITKTVEVAEVPNVAPVAEFEFAVDELAVEFDASESSDEDGEIVSYEWDFGDGSTGTGETASHEYAEASTYEVNLIVTDDDGDTGSITKTIEVAEEPIIVPEASFTVTTEGLTASFDGSESSVAEGEIVAYAWDFGDGSTGTGEMTSHEYAEADTYEVTLTVTDDRDVTSSVTKAVEVTEVPNVAPVAEFGFTADALAVEFDASESSDEDGEIVSYEWDFGDGSTGTGKTASHEYPEDGTYEVTLVVTDNDDDTGSITKTVEVSETPNVTPVAEFGFTADALAVEFDASESSDEDGEIVSYEWDFGDGSTGTGETASHEYAEADTYEVTLTVTDDEGATGSATRSVTVTETADPGEVLASDVFDRSVSNGWGPAQVGGPWTVGAGHASRYSVSDGAGIQTIHAAGHTTRMNLLEATSASTDLRFGVSVDEVPSANMFVYGVARRVGTAEYAGRARLQADGSVALHILRNNSPIVGGVVQGLSISEGEQLNIAVQTEGTSPTLIRAKTWKDGEPEPADWNYSLTDSTSGLQETGAIGLGAYLAGSASNAPINVSFSDVWAGPVGTTPGGGEVPNVAPVADFGFTADELAVEFDASESSDEDGEIVSYEWDFGDGSTGTGETTSHEYAEADTYEVTLTVTDDEGATGSATWSVTVTETADPGEVLARDAFDRSVSNGWGPADVGGPWAVGAGHASRYSVSDAAGIQTIHAAGHTTRMNLLEVASTSTDLRFGVSVDEVPSANMFVYGVARRVGTAEYAGRARLQADGSVALHILRNNSPIVGGVVQGLSISEGEQLNIAVQTEGTSPTLIRAKTWKDGEPEPADWNYSLTDSTSGLQEPGAIGLGAYLAGSASNAPINVSFSDVWAGPIGAAPSP